MPAPVFCRSHCASRVLTRRLELAVRSVELAAKLRLTLDMHRLRRLQLSG